MCGGVVGGCGGWVCKPIIMFSLAQAEQYDQVTLQPDFCVARTIHHISVIVGALIHVNKYCKLHIDRVCMVNNTHTRGKLFPSLTWEIQLIITVYPQIKHFYLNNSIEAKPSLRPAVP